MDSKFGIREALVALFVKRSPPHSKVRKAIWNSVLFHTLGAGIAQKRCATRRAVGDHTLIRATVTPPIDGNAAH